MPKQSIKLEFKNFIKGLITEASPVNFPPEASSAEENFQLHRNGTRDRRLGMGYETEYVLRDSGLTDAQLAATPPITFEWRNVRGDSSLIFLVVKMYNDLWFFDLQASAVSGTTGYKGKLSSVFTGSNDYSFASVDGRLVVVDGSGDVAIITYDGTNFSKEVRRILTRDVWGLEESTAREADSSLRSSTLTSAEWYNLYNQSWGIPRKNAAGTLDDPAAIYKTDLGVYPSSQEAVWTGLQFQPVASGVTPYERMFTNLYVEKLGADITAAKGYFVIDLLNRNASRNAAVVANVAKYPTLDYTTLVYSGLDKTTGGATSVTEFAGRVFYGGFTGTVTGGDKRSPELSNYIFFSKLVTSLPDMVKCHQEGDPTSRDSSDIVDTDGGFVRISGLDKLVTMINVSGSLLVIGTNGVWSLTGGSDYGFSATNFKVEKISDFGALSARSVVSDSGRVFYWSIDGIYVASKDQFGIFGVNNITQQTIQTFYEDIPTTSRQASIGAYDSVGKRIRWLYKEGTAFTADSVTKELILDLTINAFYVNRICNLANNSAEVFSVFKSTPFQSGAGNTQVQVGIDQVFAATNQVLVPSTGRSSGLQASRYLCVVKSGGINYFTFGYYNNPFFLDWENVDGIGTDAKAFLQTGSYTADDSSIAKQVPYLTVHFLRTENGVDSNLNPEGASSCFIRTMWDWANGYNSNKWSPLMQAYRYRKEYIPTSTEDTFDTGFQVITSRNKLRGRGKAFSLYFETEAGKDCRIIGWSLSLNGNKVT
jgi:hypothetical protein